MVTLHVSMFLVRKLGIHILMNISTHDSCPFWKCPSVLFHFCFLSRTQFSLYKLIPGDCNLFPLLVPFPCVQNNPCNLILFYKLLVAISSDLWVFIIQKVFSFQQRHAPSPCFSLAPTWHPLRRPKKPRHGGQGCATSLRIFHSQNSGRGCRVPQDPSREVLTRGPRLGRRKGEKWCELCWQGHAFYSKIAFLLDMAKICVRRRANIFYPRGFT